MKKTWVLKGNLRLHLIFHRILGNQTRSVRKLGRLTIFKTPHQMLKQKSHIYLYTLIFLVAELCRFLERLNFPLIRKSGSSLPWAWVWLPRSHKKAKENLGVKRDPKIFLEFSNIFSGTRQENERKFRGLKIFLPGNKKYSTLKAKWRFPEESPAKNRHALYDFPCCA